MKNNLYDKAYRFAARIVKAHRHLAKEKRGYVLSKQLLRSGTLIGANIAEANGAISKTDFSSKISIAYKEVLETKYWLELLKDTVYFDKRTFDHCYLQADELAKITFSILKTTRINSSHSKLVISEQ